MTNQRRRKFLKSSAGIVSGLTLSSCAPESRVAEVANEAAAVVDSATLEAVGKLVLPKTALGDNGVTRVVSEFKSWLEGFEPVAEQNHPYLWTDEILYGPPNPAPQWSSQLQGLDIEAQKRHGKPFRDLSAADQRYILGNQMPRDQKAELPYAGDAPHVAIGLLSYFYRTSEANDLAYGAAIEKQTCRGLETGPDEPGPLTATGD